MRDAAHSRQGLYGPIHIGGFNHGTYTSIRVEYNNSEQSVYCVLNNLQVSVFIF